MKVLIPVVDNESAKNDIAQKFYNAKYFCIHDSSDNTYERLMVSTITNKIGNLSFTLKRKGISSIIIREMPTIAIKLFTEMGIAVYIAQGNDLNTNLKLLEQNQLRSPNVANQDYQHIPASSCGGGSCGSCSSC